MSKTITSTLNLRKLDKLEGRVTHLKRQVKGAFALLLSEQPTNERHQDRVRHYRHVQAEYRQAVLDLSAFKRETRGE